MLKYLLLTIKIALFWSFSLQAQNVPVPQTSVPVIMKTSASWCSLCGGYGWNFFQNMLDDHQNHAVVFAGHISGDFDSMAASEIGGNFGVFGHPTFLLNGVNKGVSSGNTVNKRAEIASDVQAIIGASPTVQLGIDANYSGSQLTINYSLKAFSELNGDYHVAFYLAEKEKVGQQAPIGSQAIHKNLFRHELNGNTFGPKIFSGNTAAGTVFDNSFSVALGTYAASNIDIIGIIWKASGTSFQIVNANVDKTIQQSTHVLSTMVDETSFRVFPTIVAGYANIELISEKSMPDAEIYITDFTGKKLAGVFSGSLTSGKHHFELSKTELTHSGAFLVVFRSGTVIKTSKLFIE